MYTQLEIDDYQNRITEDQKVKLIKHCNRHNIKPIICAWYEDWEDFCSDWCDSIGYTRTQAREQLRHKQFCKFKDGTILRLEY